MGRTCGEPDEIELTPMGVELNGLGRVLVGELLTHAEDPADICVAAGRARSDQPTGSRFDGSEEQERPGPLVSSGKVGVVQTCPALLGLPLMTLGGAANEDTEWVHRGMVIAVATTVVAGGDGHHAHHRRDDVRCHGICRRVFRHLEVAAADGPVGVHVQRPLATFHDRTDEVLELLGCDALLRRCLGHPISAFRETSQCIVSIVRARRGNRRGNRRGDFPQETFRQCPP